MNLNITICDVFHRVIKFHEHNLKYLNGLKSRIILMSPKRRRARIMSKKLFSSSGDKSSKKIANPFLSLLSGDTCQQSSREKQESQVIDLTIDIPPRIIETIDLTGNNLPKLNQTVEVMDSNSSGVQPTINVIGRNSPKINEKTGVTNSNLPGIQSTNIIGSNFSNQNTGVMDSILPGIHPTVNLMGTQPSCIGNSPTSMPFTTFYQPSYAVPMMHNTFQYYNQNMGPYSFYRSSSQSEISGQSTRQHYHREHSAPPSRKNLWSKKGDISHLRKWEMLPKAFAESKTNKNGFNFTVMTYNVLAQDLIEMHPQLYTQHNRSALRWKIRWPNLLNEIKVAIPDILCLQEVQESHLNDYYKTFESLGYKGIFKKRTNDKTEGCAIYYKTDVLNLTEYSTVEYQQETFPLLNRDNVGIIAKLAPKKNLKEEFIIATTHLLYNPKRDDCRLSQVQILLAEIERFAYVKSSNNSYLPIIITGDFNALPSSGVYKFLTTGSLNIKPYLKSNEKSLIPKYFRITDNCQHAELITVRNGAEKTREEEFERVNLLNTDINPNKTISTKNGDSRLFNSGEISHNFSLHSVYNHFHKNDTEATTFQDEWITVDYIFYSGKRPEDKNKEAKIKLMERYKLPTKRQLGRITLPNYSMGSDHISLIAKFKLLFS